MKLKRMTNKKDHLVVDGRAIVTHHIWEKQVVLHFEGDKGENANQYNRMTMSHREAVEIAFGLVKAIVKSYLPKPKRKSILKRVG